MVYVRYLLRYHTFHKFFYHFYPSFKIEIVAFLRTRIKHHKALILPPQWIIDPSENLEQDRPFNFFSLFHIHEGHSIVPWFCPHPAVRTHFFHFIEDLKLFLIFFWVENAELSRVYIKENIGRRFFYCGIKAFCKIFAECRVPRIELSFMLICGEPCRKISV